MDYVNFLTILTVGMGIGSLIGALFMKVYDLKYRGVEGE